MIPSFPSVVNVFPAPLYPYVSTVLDRPSTLALNRSFSFVDTDSSVACGSTTLWKLTGESSSYSRPAELFLSKLCDSTFFSTHRLVSWCSLTMNGASFVLLQSSLHPCVQTHNRLDQLNHGRHASRCFRNRCADGFCNLHCTADALFAVVSWGSFRNEPVDPVTQSTMFVPLAPRSQNDKDLSSPVVMLSRSV